MSRKYAEAPWADDLLAYIGRSPTPWHAAASAVKRFEEAGFESLDEDEAWSLKPGHGYYVVRDSSSVIAFRVGEQPPTQSGYRMVGAHTDSPGLRLKPKPQMIKGGWETLTAEVYGGPILVTFADRDLTLAGRLAVRESGNVATRLFHHPEPLVRIPNLAIHMNRSVNDEGLKFDTATELAALFDQVDTPLTAESGFEAWLCDQAGLDTRELLGFELALCDTQPGRRYGPRGEFLSTGQLDNLTSTHAAIEALCAAEGAMPTGVVALFDHEEIGSESYKGAGGTFLQDVIARIAHGLDLGTDEQRRALARSWLVSADTAHAYHPNFPGYYDDENTVRANGGPAIKINAKQRYATDVVGEAFFAELCQRLEVPVQKYVHRVNLPCGSTIGPISAARLGVRTIDIGSPIWGMHSIRESGGALDQDYLVRALGGFLEGA
ncbi:M18 family aminopeptidase [Ectothiorhodospiraceae bacterium WFHF3C12]|nr:M18 family aminopeptidase [Ectothiorhodospiraceae bacterium WFHF3C12]